MTVVRKDLINGLTIEAIHQPKIGDREDFILQIQTPEQGKELQVPISITGTALAIWGYPDSQMAAEKLGDAIYHIVGTATQPPDKGYWFDSYNSAPTLDETIKKIYNSEISLFLKNAPTALFVRALGKDINEKIQDLDAHFAQRFGQPFFKSLEDLSEESQRIDDLNSTASDNANFLYKVSILASIIDHIGVRMSPEDDHICSECQQRHNPSEGSLQGLKRWLIDRFGREEADRLTITFQMIKKLRNQYPIHDHYIIANQVRQVKKAIDDANDFFGVVEREYETNSTRITDKFIEALIQIQEKTEPITEEA